MLPPALTWLLVFAVGHNKLFSESVESKLDATNLNLKNIGWVF